MCSKLTIDARETINQVPGKVFIFKCLLELRLKLGPHYLEPPRIILNSLMEWWFEPLMKGNIELIEFRSEEVSVINNY